MNAPPSPATLPRSTFPALPAAYVAFLFHILACWHLPPPIAHAATSRPAEVLSNNCEGFRNPTQTLTRQKLFAALMSAGGAGPRGRPICPRRQSVLQIGPLPPTSTWNMAKHFLLYMDNHPPRIKNSLATIALMHAMVDRKSGQAKRRQKKQT